MLKLLTKNGIEGFKAKEFWDADEALSVIFRASPCSRKYWIWSEDELEAFPYIPSLVERDLLWLEILKAIRDGSLQTYEEISRSRSEEETGEENEEKRINWDLIEYGNRSKNGYESNIKPQFRHYAFSCFTLEPKEYVAWYVSTQRRYQISPAFQVRKNDKGDYEWVHPPNYLEYVIAYKDPLNGIKELSQDDISYYKSLDYWTIGEVFCLIKGLLPSEQAKQRLLAFPDLLRIQEKIKRKVGLNPVSPDTPDGFSPPELLTYLRQEGLRIHPHLDFPETANASGETVYRWAPDEVEKTKETGLINDVNFMPVNEDQTNKDVDTFILDKAPQVEKLYKNSISEIKKDGREAGSLSLKDMLSAYNAKKQQYPDITEEDINEATGRFGGSQPSRDVKGAILSNMVKNKFHRARTDSSSPLYWQKIWAHYGKLKSD